MIEQDARVVSLHGDCALVESTRSSSCGGCAAQAGCGTSVLARVLATRPVQLQAVNAIGAAVGDRVVVGIPEAGLLKGSVAMYLVPLAGLFAGALAGAQVAAVLFAPGGDLFAVAGAACGLLGALVWLRGFGRSIVNHRDFQPIILRQDLSTHGRRIEISQHNGVRSC